MILWGRNDFVTIVAHEAILTNSDIFDATTGEESIDTRTFSDLYVCLFRGHNLESESNPHSFSEGYIIQISGKNTKSNTNKRSNMYSSESPEDAK